ncbi:MAG TPA: DNA repair protein RadC, partial [Limnochordia bacterium]
MAQAESVGIRRLPQEERPREKLLVRGAGALEVRDLLAIVLRTGSRGSSALELADRLIVEFGSLRGILGASVEEMARLPGMGPAKIAQLHASLELGRRLARLGADKRPLIHGPRDLVPLVMEEMRYLDREQFRAALLDIRNRLISIVLISVGHLNGSLVHPRELFKEAIRRSSAAVILVHNHPSGDPTPSSDDRA